MAKLLFSIWWKVVLVSIGFGWLVRQISKQITEDETCLHLAAYGKMREEINQLRKKLSRKKELEPDDVEILNLNCYSKIQSKTKKLVWIKSYRERIK